MGSPGFTGERQAAPVKVPGGWALGKSFLSVPNIANTVFQCRFIRNTFMHVPFEIMMISKVLNVV